MACLVNVLEAASPELPHSGCCVRGAGGRWFLSQIKHEGGKNEQKNQPVQLQQSGVMLRVYKIAICKL